MSKITDSGHLGRLERALAVEAPVSAGLLMAGQDLVDVVRFNLNNGAISGPGHIPGAAGSYSKSDSHELEQSLAVHEPIEMATSIHVAAGAFDCPHAVYQEFGVKEGEPGYVAPRPNLQLGAIETRHNAMGHIASEMRKARNA